MKGKNVLMMSIMLVVCWFCIHNTMVLAQKEEASAEAPAEETQVSKKVKATKAETTLWGLIKQGGWTMFPLGGLSVAGVGLIIYGFLISRNSHMLHPELLPQFEAALEEVDIKRATEICENTPCLLTNILHSGLERISDGILDTESMEKAMEEASVEETAAGLKPINYLSIIAQVAPMLGLLGTVSGMIKAFQKIGLGGMGDAEKLAADIGEAMITTATGLIIGIPTMFFYFYFKGKYMSNVSSVARLLGNLSHHLVTSTRKAGDEGYEEAGYDEAGEAEYEEAGEE